MNHQPISKLQNGRFIEVILVTKVPQLVDGAFWLTVLFLPINRQQISKLIFYHGTEVVGTANGIRRISCVIITD